jgi:heme-degrading monooxygenase HmoA
VSGEGIEVKLIVRALVTAILVGGVAAGIGLLLLRLADPVSLESGAGVILLIASPLLAVSAGLVVAISGREARPGGSSGPALPMPAIGYVRIGYYRMRAALVDRVARQAQADMLLLFKRDPGFIGFQMVRSGSDELISISQWETRAQAEAAVDRELSWIKATAAHAVTSTESHVGGIVLSERA